jgi:Cys-rich four helix bundle protein (predicted Tat secretion target)
MNRRELLLGAASLVAAASTSSAFAMSDGSHEHHHHHSPNPNQALIDAASDCIQRGQICLSHCLDLLSQGDKEMGDCAKSVNQMLAVCTAIQQLASQNSKHLPGLAKIAAEVCRDCEESCKKHADKHEECKACRDSCAACAKECRKIAT